MLSDHIIKENYIKIKFLMSLIVIAILVAVVVSLVGRASAIQLATAKQSQQRPQSRRR